MESDKSKRFKEVWLGKIETKEQAFKVIKECSNGFYFVAALGVLVSFFLGRGYLIDAVVFVILAFLLRKFKSRIVAIIMSLMSSLVIISTIMSALKITKGGTNMLLAVILMWISIRAVQATFKLPKLQ